ncbi:MAG: DUF445 domain-containing protein [Gammaproteobacteria bacterium]|nr:DUF445 domain-containing protein [Gammaproteobacteria bacterium]NNC97929.1 DUF445 domain-containing protein [Gammaproteobacteria bacterium]NNM14273.1 DUF445 domain-containing protein [Gammaproteobacteria bacterium]
MNPGFNEEQQAQRLRRMKFVATGLLLLMAVIFVLTHYYRAEWPWLSYVRAFSEAAMIGAIADWFAVTALFKHPLGIPIPHTAIIPKRKNEIGASLADFVKQNFLVAEVLEPRMLQVHFSRRIGNWMQQGQNANRITQDSKVFMHWIFEALDNEAIRDFAREHLRQSIQDIKAAPILARVLELLTIHNRHQNIMDLALRSAWQHLQANKHKIRNKIDNQSPWWLPSFVDREIYDKLTIEIEQTILKIGSDDTHEARNKFTEGMQEFIERLKEDPDLIARGEEIKNELLEHPAVQGYMTDMWSSVSQYLLSEVDNENSELRIKIESGVQAFGVALLENPTLSTQLDEWLQNAGMHLLKQYRDEISEVITETIQSWDPQVTSQRVELQVGRDLQFIRINGTLVGGLVGLLLYTATTHLM